MNQNIKTNQCTMKSCIGCMSLFKILVSIAQFFYLKTMSIHFESSKYKLLDIGVLLRQFCFYKSQGLLQIKVPVLRVDFAGTVIGLV